MFLDRKPNDLLYLSEKQIVTQFADMVDLDYLTAVALYLNLRSISKGCMFSSSLSHTLSSRNLTVSNLAGKEPLDNVRACKLQNLKPPRSEDLSDPPTHPTSVSQYL